VSSARVNDVPTIVLCIVHCADVGSIAWCFPFLSKMGRENDSRRILTVSSCFDMHKVCADRQQNVMGFLLSALS
jgi:hypothetical protein